MDLRLAHRLARLSDLAYEHPYKVFHETQMYWEIMGDAQWLSFAGTDSIVDAIRDISAALVHREDLGHVHDGVADYWDLMRDYCLALDKTKPVYITGHSLGGGLATVAALKMARAGFKVSGLYTFGGMRAGGSDFAGFYGASKIPTFSIVNGRDPVPFAPPTVIGFRDVVNSWHFLNGKGVVDKRPPAWTFKVWEMVDPLRFFHPLSKYIRNLEKLAA